MANLTNNFQRMLILLSKDSRFVFQDRTEKA